MPPPAPSQTTCTMHQMGADQSAVLIPAIHPLHPSTISTSQPPIVNNPGQLNSIWSFVDSCSTMVVICSGVQGKQAPNKLFQTTSERRAKAAKQISAGLSHQRVTPWQLVAPVNEAEAVLYADGARHAQLISSLHHLAHPKCCLIGQTPVTDFALCTQKPSDKQGNESFSASDTTVDARRCLVSRISS